MNQLLLHLGIILLLTSCQYLPSENRQQPDLHIGWMHGKCLAIKNAELKLPAEITVVHLENNILITKGSVVKKTTSGEKCYPLTEDRKQINIDNGYSFYLVSSDNEINLAIGLIHFPKPEKYSYHNCTTSEGIKYSMSYQGTQFWQGYYYLGYDSEETCTAQDNQL